jgi:hypothetical protein
MAFLKLRKLETGVHIYSYTGVDGVCHVKALSKNEVYKMNVWWSKLKSSLSSLDVATFTELNKSCKTCGSKLGVDCGDAEPDYDDNYCSEGCYESRNLDYC